MAEVVSAATPPVMEGADDDGAYYLEPAEIDEDESDGEYQYEEVPVDTDTTEADMDGEKLRATIDQMMDPALDDGDEDLESAMRSLHASSGPSSRPGSKATTAGRSRTGTPASRGGRVNKKPEVVDDFIRNFFTRAGLDKSLAAFQAEWYEGVRSGRIKDTYKSMAAPDIYVRNQRLEDSVAHLHNELSSWRNIADKAKQSWEKMKKERDFHRMHHKRVVQEKNKLITDVKRLRQHYSAYDPTMKELRRKYELAMKDKMLTKMDRDRLAQRLSAAEAQVEAALQAAAKATAGNTSERSSLPPTPNAARAGSAKAAGRLSVSGGGRGSATPAGSRSVSRTSSVGTRAAAARKTPSTGRPSPAPSNSTQGSTMRGRKSAMGSTSQHPKDNAWPSDDRVNPYENVAFETPPVEGFTLASTFTGHGAAVSSLALHPKKPIVATSSDDNTWKLWALPAGELIMSGEGHSSWVASCDFHPSGTHLLTSAGDGAVKLWSFETSRCVQTWHEHKQAVWSTAWHDSGDFFLTASMDHTVKALDASSGRLRQTFRGHVDSVNSVAFRPYTNILVTGSGDKTVSTWDMRSGQCLQTFYGHGNACNSVTYDVAGMRIASCDADGIVKIWDTRMTQELVSGDAGPHPANRVSFDRSGELVSVASDSSAVMHFRATSMEHICNFTGHEDAVQDIVHDPYSKYAVSCGSDGTFRIWA